jgi:hypothetical protein
MPSKIKDCTRYLRAQSYIHENDAAKRLIEAAIMSPQMHIPYGGTFVELGTFCGGAAIFIRELLDLWSREDVRLCTVDTFTGSAEHLDPNNKQYLSELVNDSGFLERNYTDNLVSVGYAQRIDSYKMESWKAATDFADRSVNAIYLDAAHDRASVLADIDAWWPKLADMAILIGDDYSTAFPGVISAVLDRFPGCFKVDGRVWYVVKDDKSDAVYQRQLAGTTEIATNETND